jgi:hypothetical protein
MNEMTAVRTQPAQAELETSEAVNEIFAALSKAQAHDLNAAAKSQNPAFKSRYADLPAIWDAIRKPLADNALCVIQAPSVSGQTVRVRTLLGHASGQWVSSTVSAEALGKDPQKVGSAITYLKRYGLSALVGAASDKDDDGNSSSSSSDAEPRRETRGAPPDTRRETMLEHARTLPPRAPQSGEPAADVVLPILWPSGETEEIRAEGGKSAEARWLESVTDTMSRAPDVGELNKWWQNNGANLGVVQQRAPRAARAAASAHTARLNEFGAVPAVAR